MGKSAEIGSRGWLAMIVGGVLLVAGLLALAVPVFLDEYDRYGIRIECGSGFHSRLTQASVNDRAEACTSALALRRGWAAPAAGLGAMILVPTVLTWARRTATGSDSDTAAGTPWSSAHPDRAIHDAAMLDRRESQHRHRPSNTTL